ncbi:Uncharacterized conserved protein YkwD, contains CAP (CSP/antigen 5/PR1) domain [Actinobaculum suis]|uniref:Uncharacterized conserved protein YkwD, contains CAP (CSP/antigen 5/PR1) domain n=1 Tax=Actinobaculum suis TaxID=1657 RepID=A0A1G7DB30_9ACTO|nr:Uncharacterized conserved protein YkwD, contains CAP (CSP/antigen 5/PR1) domain [Actinobaculum suis]
MQRGVAAVLAIAISGFGGVAQTFAEEPQDPQVENVEQAADAAAVQAAYEATVSARDAIKAKVESAQEAYAQAAAEQAQAQAAYEAATGGKKTHQLVSRDSLNRQEELALAEATIFEYVNGFREQLGIAPVVRVDGTLAEETRDFTQRMADTGVFGHDYSLLPGNDIGRYSRENIVMSTIFTDLENMADLFFELWFNSKDGHYDALIYPRAVAVSEAAALTGLSERDLPAGGRSFDIRSGK